MLTLAIKDIKNLENLDDQEKKDLADLEDDKLLKYKDNTILYYNDLSR